ncbi:MAG: efflux RND transporter periplasmic adaptor subunit [Candidatus Omnitrophota bacterium]
MKPTKNIASMALIFTFAALAIFGGIVFIGTYFAGRNERDGFLDVSGRMEGREYHAGTKFAGKVDQMWVKESQVVKAGQKIAHIHSPQLHAMIARAEARLRETESDLNLAELEYQRYARLFRERAVAKTEYDHVENRYVQAKENVVAAKREIDKLKADIEDTTIVAPISGVIVTKIVRKGEVIASGTPLVTIINMDDLYLKVFLSTDIAGKVNLGDEARVFPDALPDEEFKAVVDRIAEKAEFTPKNVETKSQRAKLVFQIKLKILENTDHRLKPGMPSNGAIKIDKKASWQSYQQS